MRENDVLFKEGTQPGTPTQAHHNYVPPLNPMPTLQAARQPHLQPHSSLNSGQLPREEPHSSMQESYDPEPAFQTYDSFGSGLVDAREAQLRSAKYDTAPVKSDVAALQSQAPRTALQILMRLPYEGVRRPSCGPLYKILACSITLLATLLAARCNTHE